MPRLVVFLSLLVILNATARSMRQDGIPSAGGVPSDVTKASTPLAVDVILARVAGANRERERALPGYTARRVYQAANPFSRSSATMTVTMAFHPPGSKDFTIVSEQGSRIIRRRIFHAALEAEKETLKPEMKRFSAISLENYDLTLLGESEIGGRRCFLLAAQPRRKDKFLLRGRVWIDATDYAMARVQGEMVKLPSFWTRKVEFQRDYQKVGEFWFPLRDESVSRLRIFGRSTLKIEYSDYQISARE